MIVQLIQQKYLVWFLTKQWCLAHQYIFQVFLHYHQGMPVQTFCMFWFFFSIITNEFFPNFFKLKILIALLWAHLSHPKTLPWKSWCYSMNWWVTPSINKKKNQLREIHSLLLLSSHLKFWWIHLLLYPFKAEHCYSLTISLVN